MNIQLKIGLKEIGIIVAGLGAIGAVTYFALKPETPIEFSSANSPNFEYRCSIDGFGKGQCHFNNNEKRYGRLCIELFLRPTSASAQELELIKKMVTMTKVCSGNLKPGDVSTVGFTINTDWCRVGYGDWRRTCQLVSP